MFRRLACSLGLVALIACQSGRDEHRDEIDAISARRAADVAEFDAARDAFARRNTTPKHLDFGAGGSLVIDECSLLGRLGHEELWVKFTYVNTTGHAIGGAHVTLTLHDPSSGAARDEVLDLGYPALRLGPDSTITAHFQVATHGIHVHPGWSWDLHAEALP